ncbi:MAG: hypothetical protein ACR2FM_02410 [Candidatus Saccharimonadales bacterium]
MSGNEDDVSRAAFISPVKFKKLHATNTIQRASNILFEDST